MIARIFSIISVLTVVGMLLLLVMVFILNRWAHQPLSLEEDTAIHIQPGDTLSQLSYSMAKRQWLAHPQWLIIYAKLTQRTKLEVGEYLIPAQVTPEELLDYLQSGDVITYTVTLIEGKTFKSYVSLLRQQQQLIDDWQEKTVDEFISENNLTIVHPEGWFYPDTYVYVSGTTVTNILLRAHDKMKRVLNEEWSQRANDLPYSRAYEALIMASIVEKETGVAHEREQIAGVFVRRLQKGMKLQTDPTIIYGLGDAYKGNIRRKHLTQATPYNTYVINGLPPTPIAMPGRAAIHAALHPAEGNSLFFVAKGDGSHYFSETYEEHNKAVQEYQVKNRTKNYQSAPKK